MNLKELAAINGLSLSTAKRYRKEGVSLADQQAVAAHKHAQRTRFGLSKLNHRARSINTAAVSERVEELEDVIYSVHFRAVVITGKHPELADELSAITRVTGPLIDRMSEDLLLASKPQVRLLTRASRL